MPNEDVDLTGPWAYFPEGNGARVANSRSRGVVFVFSFGTIIDGFESGIKERSLCQYIVDKRLYWLKVAKNKN